MVTQKFRKKTLIGALSFMLSMPLTGCGWYAVVAGLGALGGYMISPDTVEGVLPNTEIETVWAKSVEILEIMGTVTERNDEANILLANVQGTRVTVTAYTMNHSNVKLTVKARKAFLPKSIVAQEVYIKIVDRLEGE